MEDNTSLPLNTEAPPTPPAGASKSIRAALQEEIESGQLPPGSPLDERGLAERFGVSRTPVREALQQLAAKDLVKLTPRHGAMVARLSISEIRGLMEVLGELESFAARLAARRVDDASRAQLQAALQRCRDAQNLGVGEYAMANISFHEVIFSISRNQYLTQQLRRTHRLIQRYRSRDFQSRTQVAKSMLDHERVTQAICDGDENAAALAMAEHVPSGSSGFSEFLAKVPPHYFESEAS
jgi:DNA-binding GntR family transcriptional regulator